MSKTVQIHLKTSENVHKSRRNTKNSENFQKRPNESDRIRTNCRMSCMISNRFQVNHAALLHDAPGPHPDDQACQAKAQTQFGGAWAQGRQAAPPNWVLGFGLTGLVIRMGPWSIMQECCMIHLESCRRCMISTNHAGHPTAWMVVRRLSQPSAAAKFENWKKVNVWTDVRFEVNLCFISNWT